MFEKLFASKKKKPSARELEPLAPGLVQTILNVVGSKGIPSMPAAAQKAFTLATDPNAEARDFVEVIEADEALSARVLKIANSVFYDRGSSPNSIEAAVTVIGLNELRALLNASSLSEIFPSRNIYRAILWANDIGTALAARNLARILLPKQEDSIFLAGLMHDIGKLLLLQRCPEDYQRVIKFIESDGITFEEAENRRFPFSHTQVGQLVAESWHFSSELSQAISCHHLPWASISGPNAEMIKIIKLADIIADAQGWGHPATFTRYRNHAQEALVSAWTELNIPQSDVGNLLADVNKSFQLEYDLYANQGRSCN